MFFREASGEDATKKKPVDSEKDALKSRKQMEDSRQVLMLFCVQVNVLKLDDYKLKDLQQQIRNGTPLRANWR